MSLEEFNRRVDAEEFAWLKALDRYEPFGRETEVLATGFALLANQLAANAGIKAGIEPANLMPPGTIQPERTVDPAAMESGMEQSARAAGEAIKRRR